MKKITSKRRYFDEKEDDWERSSYIAALKSSH